MKALAKYAWCFFLAALTFGLWTIPLVIVAVIVNIWLIKKHPEGSERSRAWPLVQQLNIHMIPPESHYNHQRGGATGCKGKHYIWYFKASHLINLC